MASLFLIKIICCSIVMLANGISAFATFIFVHKRCITQDFSPRLRQGLAQANCFSIGLFLSVCFLGLYNSSSMKMRIVQSALEEGNPLKTYPLSEAILCWGLFIFWLFEWTVRFLISRISANNLRKQVFYVKSWKRSHPNRFAMDPAYCDDTDEQVDLLAGSSDSFPDHVTDSLVDQSSAETLPSKTVKTVHLPTSSFLKSVLLASAMSIHSFLEALGFGLLDSINQVVSMSLAMLLHQLLCSSTLGLRLARASDAVSKRRYALAILVGYLLILPVGTVVGSTVHAIHNTHFNISADSTACSNNTVECHLAVPPSIFGQLAMSVLQNLAASAFLYVVFVEMLPAEVSSGMPCSSDSDCSSTLETPSKQGALCCLFAFLGFLLISAIRFAGHG
ncbi:hypothetical protein EG68_05766 [Paragonimus skrjabini miyazakii]|uniref:Uncharacterized protein n=1 Tax=Paragonimus skrjabini miyazakii TaxID=59628 RepID=A0A8S9YQ38_9TREM|nr:hypothetical protein EG68_05766 [Paragonimus skrjabini miyazakii]